MKQLVITLLFLTSFSLHAYSGGELLIDCKWYIDVSENKGTTNNISKSLSAGRCQGFISGTVNSYSQFIKDGLIQQNLFCLPENTNTTKLAKTITSYLKQHEDMIETNASELTFDAFAEAYPCE